MDDVRVLSDSRLREIVLRDFTDVLLAAHDQASKPENVGKESKEFREGVKVGSEAIHLRRRVGVEVVYDDVAQEASLMSGTVKITAAQGTLTQGCLTKWLLKMAGGTPGVQCWSLESYGR
jgi:hypothetical protein